MLGHSVIEAFENEEPRIRKLQDELDGLNQTFERSIIFYPEAYAAAKVSLQPGDLNQVESTLEQVSSEMEHIDQKLKAENKKRRARNAVYTEEESILEGVYNDLGRRLLDIDPNNGSEQLKMDKVKIYRHNIVKMVYLIGGIGIVSKTLYDFLM